MLEAVGLPREEAVAWQAAAPELSDSFEADSSAATEFLTQGEALLRRLPMRPRRTEREQAAASAIADALTRLATRFLRGHAEAVYAELTDDFATGCATSSSSTRPPSVSPGSRPRAPASPPSCERKLADKEGVELAQGLFLAHVLASPRSGAHLVGAMLRPTAEALERLDELRATGVVDLGHGPRAPRGPGGRAGAAQPAPPQRRGRHHARARRNAPST